VNLQICQGRIIAFILTLDEFVNSQYNGLSWFLLKKQACCTWCHNLSGTPTRRAVLHYVKDVNMETKWIDWVVELQSIAQAGLHYSKDVFDKERFERIREITAEMMSKQSDLPIEVVKDLFCNESGYQTPKMDTRAAIFQDDKILLVREKDKWSLPGGWIDVNQSVKSNTAKEVKEEAGLDVIPVRL
jgi:hypothetical protein